MIPGLPLTLGFSPDDELIEYLADTVIHFGFDHAVARSVVKQLLDTVAIDFVNGTVAEKESAIENPSLYDYLSSTEAEDIYTACYATYRPSNCRCIGDRMIFFQLTFKSDDQRHFYLIDIELVDESITRYMPHRAYYPTSEERYRANV